MKIQDQKFCTSCKCTNEKTYGKVGYTGSFCWVCFKQPEKLVAFKGNGNTNKMNVTDGMILSVHPSLRNIIPDQLTSDDWGDIVDASIELERNE